MSRNRCWSLAIIQILVERSSKEIQFNTISHHRTCACWNSTGWCILSHQITLFSLMGLTIIVILLEFCVFGLSKFWCCTVANSHLTFACWVQYGSTRGIHHPLCFGFFLRIILQLRLQPRWPPWVWFHNTSA